MSAITIKKVNIDKTPTIFIGVGALNFQLEKSKAEFLCRLLADFVGLKVVKKTKIKKA